MLVVDQGHDAERVPGGYAAWEAARHVRTSRTATSTTSTTSGPPANKGAGRSQRAAERRRTNGRAVPATAGPSASPRPASEDIAERAPGTLRHLMKDAEKAVRRLEKRRSALASDLALLDGSDHQRLATVGSELAGVEAELAATEERWLTLAEEADI